ncbi:urease accessory protein UreG [Cellulosimicrobium sp. CUA-896]|uniref:urease accessory protein UreG n=1 Tax=Cellulosimicrobium sp. CUA-896 TaxID=1517881 RepID=UPI0009F9F4F2
MPAPPRGCSVPDQTTPAPAATTAPASTRSLRLGVAGPVGTGKSSLIALLCRELSAELRLGVITNDIYTDEDARFLRSAGVLDPERIRAVETGACPHTAIRDDVTANLLAVEDLEEDFAPLDVVLVESGGDNLTATFSPALVDAQIFVLDVAGGGDVARKGGPGIARADLLVVNKTDLAPHVGVDVPQMVADATAARDGAPVLALSRDDREAIGALTTWLHTILAAHRSGAHVPQDPGPMAPHFHADEDGTGYLHTHGDGDAAHDHDHGDDGDGARHGEDAGAAAGGTPRSRA